ncbi:MAG: nicotinate-nucleotide adenylyltransferase [Dehalococcoidia bacterium]|nr:nicotinate-nucleotide adenylyltransferase [Dehalococcoidia bacterium]
MELTGANSSRVGRIRSRIGVLGGTFDPIHNGHLAIAAAVFNVLELTSVLFVPAARPWMKESGSGYGVSSIDHRIEMVKLATERREGFYLSTVDADRGGSSYSVDTISDLREEYGHATELLLILGADALEELPRWREPERLASMCTLVCVGRPGSGLPEDLPADHPGRDAQFVSGPMLPISATDIRARVAAGMSIEGLVGASVGAYIERHGLYRRDPA